MGWRTRLRAMSSIRSSAMTCRSGVCLMLKQATVESEREWLDRRRSQFDPKEPYALLEAVIQIRKRIVTRCNA